MKRMPWRLAIALLMGLSVFGIAEWSPVIAQEGTASLTIHSRFCPLAYDMSDVYGTCHDTVGDRAVEFYLPGISERAGTAGEDGNLTFSGLFAGLHRLQNTFPSEIHSVYVYCSSQFEPDRRFDVQGGSYGGYLVDITLQDDENMICDWYTSPNGDYDSSRASLTIHSRICPVGFADFGNEWSSCLSTDMTRYLNFWIDDPLTRVSWPIEGILTYSWLRPSTYAITTNLNIPSKVYCSTMDTVSTPFFEQSLAPYSQVILTVEAGDDLVCDWYGYPSTEDWLDL